MTGPESGIRGPGDSGAEPLSPLESARALKKRLDDAKAARVTERALQDEVLKGFTKPIAVTPPPPVAAAVAEVAEPILAPTSESTTSTRTAHSASEYDAAIEQAEGAELFGGAKPEEYWQHIYDTHIAHLIPEWKAEEGASVDDQIQSVIAALQVAKLRATSVSPAPRPSVKTARTAAPSVPIPVRVGGDAAAPRPALSSLAHPAAVSSSRVYPELDVEKSVSVENRGLWELLVGVERLLQEKKNIAAADKAKDSPVWAQTRADKEERIRQLSSIERLAREGNVGEALLAVCECLAEISVEGSIAQQRFELESVKQYLSTNESVEAFDILQHVMRTLNERCTPMTATADMPEYAAEHAALQRSLATLSHAVAIANEKNLDTAFLTRLVDEAEFHLKGLAIAEEKSKETTHIDITGITDGARKLIKNAQATVEQLYCAARSVYGKALREGEGKEGDRTDVAERAAARAAEVAVASIMSLKPLKDERLKESRTHSLENLNALMKDAEWQDDYDKNVLFELGCAEAAGFVQDYLNERAAAPSVAPPRAPEPELEETGLPRGSSFGRRDSTASHDSDWGDEPAADVRQEPSAPATREETVESDRPVAAAALAVPPAAQQVTGLRRFFAWASRKFSALLARFERNKHLRGVKEMAAEIRGGIAGLSENEKKPILARLRALEAEAGRTKPDSPQLRSVERRLSLLAGTALGKELEAFIVSLKKDLEALPPVKLQVRELHYDIGDFFSWLEEADPGNFMAYSDILHHFDDQLARLASGGTLVSSSETREKAEGALRRVLPRVDVPDVGATQEEWAEFFSSASSDLLDEAANPQKEEEVRAAMRALNAFYIDLQKQSRLYGTIPGVEHAAHALELQEVVNEAFEAGYPTDFMHEAAARLKRIDENPQLARELLDEYQEFIEGIRKAVALRLSQRVALRDENVQLAHSFIQTLFPTEIKKARRLLENPKEVIALSGRMLRQRAKEWGVQPFAQFAEAKQELEEQGIDVPDEKDLNREMRAQICYFAALLVPDRPISREDLIWYLEGPARYCTDRTLRSAVQKMVEKLKSVGASTPQEDMLYFLRAKQLLRRLKDMKLGPSLSPLAKANAASMPLDQHSFISIREGSSFGVCLEMLAKDRKGLVAKEILRSSNPDQAKKVIESLDPNNPLLKLSRFALPFDRLKTKEAPVIVALKRPDGSNHWVIVDEYRDGHFVIRDPERDGLVRVPEVVLRPLFFDYETECYGLPIGS